MDLFKAITGKNPAEFEQAAEMLQEILEKEDKKASGAPVDACVPVVREPAK